MPLTATGKVDKRPLRREGWDRAEAVWWRPGRDLSVERLAPARADALRAEFARYGRAHMLAAGGHYG
jgi:fatty-acyl-CoA synthase